MKTKAPSVREVAVSILEKVLQGAKLQEELDYVLSSSNYGKEDRHLLSELCYGVLRCELRLKFILELFLPNLSKLPSKCLLILYIAVYSLLFLERIPLHAVVYEAVESGKKWFGKALGGVINACLRKLIPVISDFKDLEPYTLKCDPKDISPILKLARFYSLPTWLLKYWSEVYGLEAALNLAKRSFTKPQIAIILNSKHPQSYLLEQALKLFHVKH